LSKPPKKLLPDGTDLEKLAKAVALHETNDCTKGNSAIIHKNAFGIRECYGGRCYGFKTYRNCEESFLDFERIWSSYYNKFPDIELARKYSGNDRADSWLRNVKNFYSTL